MVLPAMGVMSEIIATFSRREVFGYRFVAMSSIAIALIGFFVWGHHMFPNGQSAPANVIFSALTVLVAIPSAIKVWNWLATLYKGSIWLRTPMCYALGFFVIFSIGGLTGLPLAILPTNFHDHDTYFVVAHFHYVMFSVVFLFVGGLFYWWPKITGRMYNEPLGQFACLLEFVAFHLTFIPQFLMGLHGMPRRSAIYLSRVPSVPRDLEHRGVPAVDFVPARGGVPLALALPRQEGPGQPLGRLDAGMELCLAAAARQFPRAAHRRPALRPRWPGVGREDGRF